MPINKETSGPETKSVAVGPPTLDESFENIFEALGDFVKSAKAIQDNVKNLHKQCKHLQKKKRNSTSRVQIPLVLSKELCNFLKVPLTKRMSKADVMKSLSNYIKISNLQIPENKRRFKPNKDLCKLFKIKPGEVKNMTFVEINKYISQHVTKPLPINAEEDDEEL